MPMGLDDQWVWDFWFAQRGDEVHLFFLHAPRSLGQEWMRHQNARIGHSVSHDLHTWRRLPDPLPDAVPGAPDDRATWTGSVVRAHDGMWHMFYTGVCVTEDGQVQRILSATSPDLLTWTRTGVRVEADPRWYERWTADLPEEHWRDPWVDWDDDAQCWRMYITARSPHGPGDGRGVVATAQSPDLFDWVVGPPVCAPGEYRQLEVTQLVRTGDRYALLFSAGAGDVSAARTARLSAQRCTGTRVLYGKSPSGPFEYEDEDLLLAAADAGLYAGRLIRHQQAWWFLGWRTGDGTGEFIGDLADPLPVDITGDRIAVSPSGQPAGPGGARSARPA